MTHGKSPPSKAQVDHLGERLRLAEPSDDDLRLLDAYRQSFGEAYDFVVKNIKDNLQLDPSGRPAKSTTSIRDKLRRESVRLSQMQDIAGCRIVTPDIADQNQAVERLKSCFPDARIIDRRVHPSHGYRSVHLVVRQAGRPIEIQVRSHMQHIWAEISEKIADVSDPAVKYGGGPQSTKEVLATASKTIERFEEVQGRVQALKTQTLPPEHLHVIGRLEADLLAIKAEYEGILELLATYRSNR